MAVDEGGSDYSYQGLELELFARAIRWNNYLASFSRPFVQGEVLEVGAGMGNRTPFFLTERVSHWLCLEPDDAMAASLAGKLARGTGSIASPRVRSLHGNSSTLEQLERKGEAASFDTILYLDVLEHIEDDRGEIERISRFLRPGGHLLVVAPAHPFLYSPFDKGIGHFRRYQKSGLRQCLRLPQLKERELFYVDSMGLLLSLVNRVAFRRSMPSLGTVLFWDRCLVPLSRLLDPILMRTLGKSLFGVWRKEGT